MFEHKCTLLCCIALPVVCLVAWYAWYVERHVNLYLHNDHSATPRPLPRIPRVQISTLIEVEGIDGEMTTETQFRPANRSVIHLLSRSTSTPILLNKINRQQTQTLFKLDFSRAYNCISKPFMISPEYKCVWCAGTHGRRRTLRRDQIM